MSGERPAMDLSDFIDNYRAAQALPDVTDASGTVWKPAPAPARNGEPTYYSTECDGYALTVSEIEAHYGRR